MPKLMIIGGTGLLGHHTALEALEHGFEVSSLSVDDAEVDEDFKKKVDIHILDVFKASQEEIANALKGYDYMIYSVGPDDRVTPKAPADKFFHQHLVEDAAKVFRAARDAGVKKSVLYNSYFAYFDREMPELKLYERHPYVRARVDQAKKVNEEKGKMEVVVLELPYIFGTVHGRSPLWRDVFLNRFIKGKSMLFFPKGKTTMTTVKHIAESGVGAILYGKDGMRYPIGDENKDYHYMLNTMLDELYKGTGKKPHKVHNAPRCFIVMGGKAVMKAELKKGLEPGLDFGYIMKDIMTRDVVVPEAVLDKVANELHLTRGGLDEAIRETARACYPNGSFFEKDKK